MKAKNPLSPCEFYNGHINSKMANLIGDGRNPISPSQVYWLRLVTLNNYLGALKRQEGKAENAWPEMVKYWNRFIDTGFGVVKHPDKGAILVPDASFLRELNPGTELSNKVRYIKLPDGAFEVLKDQGHHYTDAEVKQYGNLELSQENALTSPLIKDIIPNENLRNAVVVNVFDQYKKGFGGPDDLMGVFFPDAQKPVAGLFDIGMLKSRSNADSRYYLGFPNGRLGGVLPDFTEGDVRKLEHILHR